MLAKEMNREEIPTTIESDSGTIDFGQIHRDFSQTKYGEILLRNIRWARFKPEKTTNEQWNKLLGADVNNLKHLQLTYGLARQFINYNYGVQLSTTHGLSVTLTKKEKEDLLLAATVHDWGEAIIGDINYDFKTKENEEEESEHLKKIAQEIYRGKNKELAERIELVIDDVIKDPDTKLGKIFNVIEKIGYLRTALNAWNKSRDEVDEDLKTNLRWLVAGAFPRLIIEFIEHSKIYPAVTLYLKENKEIIEEIFNGLPEEIFSKFESEQIKAQKKEKYEQSKKAWQDYYQKLI